MIPENGVQMKDDEAKPGDEGRVLSVPVTKCTYAAPSISVIGNVVELLAGDGGNYDDSVAGLQSSQPPQ
jgi:hypothetical protein